MKLYLDNEYELDAFNKINYFSHLYGASTVNNDVLFKKVDKKHPYKIRITDEIFKYIPVPSENKK